MKKVNVAVVGLGYWGPNILRNFQKIPGAHVKWICDIDRKILESVSLDYPNLKKTREIDEVLVDPEVELIAIATPLSSHFNLAKASLLAGKNVLIEKPMTSSVLEAEELVNLAKKSRKQIFVGHTFVYSEPIRYLKRMIDKKELGKIFYYDSTRINLGLVQEDSNVLWDLAPHDISIIQYLFPQKAVSVRAIGSSFLRRDIEELVHLFINLEDNISCHIQLSWLSPVKMRNIVIAGSKKMITYNDIDPSEKIKIYDKGVSLNKSEVSPFSPAYRSGEIKIPKISQTEPLLSELTHFINCLRNGKRAVTGEQEGLEAIRIIEFAEKSLRTEKKISL